LSKISPHIKDNNADNIKEADKRAVGILGTRPVCQYSISTGTERKMADKANTAAVMPKNANGLSEINNFAMVFKILQPSL
jgi:aspartate/glutamate racemase